MAIPEHVRQQAKIELSRRFFWDFEQTMYPELFTDERKLLKTVADTMQDFYENSDKHYLVLSLPPGHYKSFTGKNFAMWLMGRDPTIRVIGASNSHDLAEMFSSQVRDTILGLQYGRGGLRYSQIFPSTRIKQGYATKAKWELEGSPEPSYRVATPGGAITGSRADVFLIDDVIKNHLQALNARELDAHWDWYRNTLFSRTDGDNYKFIFIMQRWAKGDLAGRIIDHYGDDVVHINFPIEDKDGNMLEPTIMSRRKLEETRKTMMTELFKANYYQQPVDIEGRLYDGFEEWTTLPKDIIKVNNTDVADQGKDNICSINWGKVQTDDGIKVYITDIFYSPEKAEITEPKIARMLTADNITEAEFESNNGGKGYARNIERELLALGNTKTVVKWTPQTANKEARILASSAWNAKNILMPPNWVSKYPEFASEVLGYVAGGKNAHDDGVDVLASLYERAANFKPIDYGWAVA